MVWNTRVILSFVAFGVLGCGPDIIEAASDDLAGSESEAGSEDEIGDVETGTGSSSSSSTDDDPSTSDTSTSDTSTTDSTSDTNTTDSTTDTSTTESTSESTDTVVDTGCVDPISFMIPAIDYAGESGWEVTMSTLGEGMIVSWDEMDNYDWISWNLDIPCDDTWHVWVRAIEEGSDDSLWIRVDGEPQNWGVFELDCTDNPWDPTYKWKELNWRDPNGNICQYIADPWTHDWNAGIHELELAHRESWAISKIWVTNTGNPPP